MLGLAKSKEIAITHLKDNILDRKTISIGSALSIQVLEFER